MIKVLATADKYCFVYDDITALFNYGFMIHLTLSRRHHNISQSPSNVPS
jgi:hypothetical protein